jgi:hypothetical protein
VRDHRVILLQVQQGLAQLRMRCGDRGEQLAILTLVVSSQRSAEPMAEQQQIARSGLGGFAAVQRGTVTRRASRSRLWTVRSSWLQAISRVFSPSVT